MKRFILIQNSQLIIKILLTQEVYEKHANSIDEKIAYMISQCYAEGQFTIEDNFNVHWIVLETREATISGRLFKIDNQLKTEHVKKVLTEIDSLDDFEKAAGEKGFYVFEPFVEEFSFDQKKVEDKLSSKEVIDKKQENFNHEEVDKEYRNRKAFRKAILPYVEAFENVMHPLTSINFELDSGLEEHSSAYSVTVNNSEYCNMDKGEFVFNVWFIDKYEAKNLYESICHSEFDNDKYQQDEYKVQIEVYTNGQKNKAVVNSVEEAILWFYDNWFDKYFNLISKKKVIVNPLTFTTIDFNTIEETLSSEEQITIRDFSSRKTIHIEIDYDSDLTYWIYPLEKEFNEDGLTLDLSNNDLYYKGFIEFDHENEKFPSGYLNQILDDAKMSNLMLIINMSITRNEVKYILNCSDITEEHLNLFRLSVIDACNYETIMELTSLSRQYIGDALFAIKNKIVNYRKDQK